MASHGFVVFMPDHLDGTSCYTEDANGDSTVFDKSGGYYEENLDRWTKMEQTRSNEIKCLVKEICSNKFSEKLFGSKKPCINIEKLVMTGYSTGGGSSLMSGCEIDNFKAVIALDPRLFVLQDKIVKH